mgnify:FL=1
MRSTQSSGRVTGIVRSRSAGIVIAPTLGRGRYATSEVSGSSLSLATSAADGRGGAFADGGCAFGAEALRWAASQHLATRFVIRQSPPPVQTVIPVPGAAKGLERGLRGWPEVGRAPIAPRRGWNRLPGQTALHDSCLRVSRPRDSWHHELLYLYLEVPPPCALAPAPTAGGRSERRTGANGPAGRYGSAVR